MAAVPSEIIVPIVTTALGGIFGLCRALLKLWAWNRHEKRKAREAALQGPASKPELSPSPPPDIGSIAGLIAVLVGSAMIGVVAAPLVARNHLEAVTPKSKCTSANCKGKCVGGRCQVTAEPPDGMKTGPTTSADSLVLRSVFCDDLARFDPI